MTDCRITIVGRKIWRDGDNVDGTRPDSVEVKLLRDDKDYKQPITVSSKGDGEYVFLCLPVRKNDGNKYIYTVDEVQTPPKYIKTIEGYNIINTIEPGTMTINCSKTWMDNNDESGERPDEITVHLLQNGVRFRPAQVLKPPVGEDKVEFKFENVPRFDDKGNLFVYTVDEEDLPEYYKKSIDGFDITNTIEKTPYLK